MWFVNFQYYQIKFYTNTVQYRFNIILFLKSFHIILTPSPSNSKIKIIFLPITVHSHLTQFRQNNYKPTMKLFKTILIKHNRYNRNVGAYAEARSLIYVSRILCEPLIPRAVCILSGLPKHREMLYRSGSIPIDAIEITLTVMITDWLAPGMKCCLHFTGPSRVNRRWAGCTTQPSFGELNP